jgi:Xaa-Pro dipeptidase
MEGIRDRERDTMIREAMRAAGLKAILAWHPEDLVMACGSFTCLAIDLCLYPAQGDPVFYASRFEPDDVLPAGFIHRRFSPQPGTRPGAWAELSGLLREDLRRLSIAAAELGVPEDGGGHAVPSFPGETPPLTAAALSIILGGAPPRDATSAFTAAGLRKTRREVECIRRANALAGAGLAAFYAGLVPGRTEAEVAAAVEAAVHARSGRDGSRLARAWAHVQGGANVLLAGTYSRSSGAALAEGDMVVLELATCVDGYWSDLTRTGCVGQAGRSQKALMDAVKEAQAAAMAAVRPGARHEEVDAAARAVLAARGFGAGFTHGCGHHVGFRYHDRGPALAAGQREPLAEGMVITIEPGAYGAAFGGGCRFEDNVLVVPAGAEVLSPIGITARI